MFGPEADADQTRRNALQKRRGIEKAHQQRGAHGRRFGP
jgi:hypothetical protein